jgi:hypothetical protein
MTPGIQRPLLYLDVDGVLAPFGAAAPPGYEEHRFGAETDVWLNLDHATVIAALRERFAVVWCTARDDVAQTVARALGHQDLPVLGFETAGLRDGARVRSATWKLAWVDQHADGRPLAWVDDELGPDAHRWAAGRPQPTLLICPTPSVGLTVAHVDELEAFARRAARR